MQSDKTRDHPILLGLLIIGIIVGCVNNIFDYFAIHSYKFFLFFYPFMLFFALSYDLRNTKRLFCSAFLAAGLFALPACYPIAGCSEWSAALIPNFIIISYALLAFHYAYHLDNGFKFNYTHLFNGVWNTFCLFFITAIFTLLGWGLIQLTASVFSIIDFGIISTIISSQQFTIFILPVLFFVGLAIGRQTDKLIINLRWILLNIFRYLLPFLAVIALLFLAAALLRSLLGPSQLLHDGAAIYQSIILLGIIFFNAVYQDGKISHAYSETIGKIVNGFIFLLPIFAVLNLIIFINTIPHFTLAHINAYIYTIMLLLYSCAYSAMSLVNVKQEYHWLAKINITLAVVYIGVMVIANNYWTYHLENKPCSISANNYVYPSTQQLNLERQQQAENRARENAIFLQKVGLRWTTSSTHPQAFVRAGNRYGQQIGVCRSQINGVWWPGEYFSEQCQVIIHHKIVAVNGFDILTGSQAAITWDQNYYENTPAKKKQKLIVDQLMMVDGNPNSLLNTAVLPNTDFSIEPIYVCRTIFSDEIYVGSFFKNQCRIVVNQKIQTTHFFQILIASSK
ncbi:MAG: hypothetical protein KIT27_09105 [Legionellales bacterium]|nr:hypothetical protein [Legionellales bacterium]